MAKSSSLTAALVLAAGRGTRMRSRLPKVLHRAGGRTMLDAVLAAVAVADIAPAHTAVVAGYGLEAVRAAVAERGPTVLLQEPQLGTGHAVRSAQAWWSAYDQLVVVHGDMPLLSSATVAGLAHHRIATNSAAVLATASPREPRPYGRILRDPSRPERVLAIVEDKQCSPEQARIRELNAGFYCFSTAPLSAALAQLTTDNPHGEYYLTDVVAVLARAGHPVAGFPLADPDECLGVNDRVELAALDADLRRRKVEQIMRAGVTVQLPATVVIDPEVEVGEDTLIEPGAQLLGRTRVGANCVVRSHSILQDCTVEDGATVGPFARLREGAHIGPGAHIGNFVEVKKSRIGRGSKANHLAYLGDAVVGDGANIGAGTITCNYDGVHKHPTAIGDGAFIGSNSTLVAPVEIGAGAYVAAGSVITHPVEPDALALGRARQATKPGWAAKRRTAKSND